MWLRPDDGPRFSPREAEEWRKKQKAESRTSPSSTNRKRDEERKKNPKREIGDAYTTSTYRKLVERACRAAGVPVWTPNQLRHRGLTNVARIGGPQAARPVPDHHDARSIHRYVEQYHALHAHTTRAAPPPPPRPARPRPLLAQLAPGARPPLACSVSAERPPALCLQMACPDSAQRTPALCLQMACSDSAQRTPALCLLRYCAARVRRYLARISPSAPAPCARCGLTQPAPIPHPPFASPVQSRS